MRSRRLIWMVLCLLCVAGAWWFWRLENRTAEKTAARSQFSYTAPRPVLPGQLPAASQPVPARVRAVLATNAFALRLSNTAKSIGELVNDPRAILLENALIDTGSPLNFSIPKHLQAPGDPGAYIVQARGPINAAFRGLLARAGADIVSYIPNDAYLVKVSAGGAGALADSPLTQSVIPYEPYYKIQSSLLNLAVGQKPLPDGAVLNLGLFAASAPQTIAEIEQLGGRVLARDASPFGPVVRVQPPANWTALAALPGVQIMEPFHPRVHANDLSRVNTGVAVDTLTNATYLGWSGSNVMVAMADSGIDAKHPGFTTGGSLGAPGAAPIRVFGLTTNDLTDADGHGTHVAGIIAGNGDMSTSPVNVGAILQNANYGSVSNADFRGKAPLAKLFVMNMNLSDQALQENAALTNALIENDSWNYDGDNTYNLAAASYDAATRDALPGVTGSQPVLFVFSAGNAGNGDDSNDPGGGYRDTIQSPATAKNVVSVGAIQEQRDITNQVTEANGTTNQPWLPGTSTSYRVAGFSSRGNVGIGIEGANGRFKPDVVAPGTFIVSTRSSQFDVQKYFYVNPTNTDTATYDGVIADPDSLWVNGFPIVPNNAIGVNITVSPNTNSPVPFPLLPIYFAMIGAPFYPNCPFTTNNQVNIPPDGGWTIAAILNSETLYGFNYGISNITSEPISFDLTTTIITTNGVGNGMLVLSNLDNTLGPYYRFESGTSMAAADVSGLLALIQDFFTNTLHTTPSPALLKAMLINGARPTGVYNLQVNNSINFVGWGLVNLPNSLPTNSPASFNGTTPSAIYFQDQSPTNALATGDSHTFLVTVQTNTTDLRVTLVWTDPPGNPAAAIKLVNNLELVVTNLDNPTNPVIYYGNDIPAGYLFNAPEGPKNTVVPDAINNVQNVIIPPFLGTNYSITVIGRGVNVNAVSAQTNSYNNANPSGVFAPNVAQDYALVVSSVDFGVPGAFTVTDNGIVSNPTGDQDITFVTQTNQPLLNQFVGTSSPLPGTNTVALGADTMWGANGAVVLGETNQWHFYVVTNNGVISSNGTVVAAPYAGFVTFLSPTLSVPRMGVFAGSQANATRPQADIDLYVTTDPTLTNLNPAAITTCLNGTVVPGSVFNGVSLSRGGTEYVVDTNSAAGEVYYIGVKSEDQMGSEYDFFPVFSSNPFSSLDANGDETVNGVPVPVNIPDGTPANPGMNFVLGLAIYPIEVANITVTTEFTHQNFGDLYGTLTHDDGATGAQTVDVLNNHDGWGSVTNQFFIYNETNVANTTLPPNPIFGPSDGPGSLQNYFGQDGSGVWRLTEVDDALTQTGRVQGFTMFIKKRTPLGNGSGETNTLAGQQWFYDFVDVPPGATNLIISVTNLTSSPLPLDVFVKLGAQPTTNNYDKSAVVPVTPPPQPGISLSIGPTDVPPIQPGRYWIGVFNPNQPPPTDPAQTFSLFAAILPANPVGTTADFAATGSTPLLDDAVTNADIFITNTMPVVSVNVGIRVDDPRISDLVFHLISPDGTRVLLMENRGGTTTNGAGATYVTTNSVNATANGTAQPNTNYLNVGETSGTLAITYNFYTASDEMTVYYGTNTTPANLIFDTGVTNNLPASGPPNPTNTIPVTFTLNFGPTNGVVSTYLTIVMDQFLPTNRSDAWTYTAGGTLTNYAYLTFTEDTNLTTTPIKYAMPPFAPVTRYFTNIQTNIVFTTNSTTSIVSDFESPGAGEYLAASTVDNWSVVSNQVSVVNDPANSQAGSQFLALASGSISRTLPTVVGATNILTFAYHGPGIAGWWRAESNALDSINGNNGTIIGTITNYTTVWTNGFEGGSAADFVTNQVVAGWTVNSNQVSLVTDANTACRGNNFLALANGTISTNLSTIAGQTYTLSFAYRGPGIAGWWRAENNTNDSINGNNPTGVQNITFTGGEVGQAFHYDGSTSLITMPASASLAVSNLTLEAWVYPTDNTLRPVIEWGGAGQNSPMHLWVNTTGGSGSTPGGIHAIIRGSPGFEVDDSNPDILLNKWNHLVFTYNAVARTGVLYANGIQVQTSTAPGSINAVSSFAPVNIGYRDVGTKEIVPGRRFLGNLDEVSVYNRPLSASEIKAIWAKGTAGKFDPIVFGTSPAKSLAEAQVSVTGQTNVTLLGSNTVWQTYSKTFIATTNQTLFSITGLQPGILLDEFVLTTNVINSMGAYTNGEVGTAFSFNGVNQYVMVPQASNINSFGNQITIEFWMKGDPGNPMNTYQGLVDTDHYGVEISNGFSANVGVNFFVDTGNGSSLISSANGGGLPISAGVWHHVVGAYDSNKLQLYVDGLPAGNSAPASGIITPMISTSFLGIGSDDGRTYCGCGGRYFWGLIDEASIYNRALSPSEIKAIYNLGTAGKGKFDPSVFITSPAQSLAEAKVSLAGQTSITINGSNTAWQTNTITFIATTNATSLQIDGLEPGMLLDSATLTSFTAVTNTVTNIVAVVSNLYYLPEQTLDALAGKSGYGDWQLEVQDDRAGAYDSNSPPALVSWELQFVFDNTNAIPAVVSGGIGQTNQFIPAGGIAWYQINVPTTNANYATNRLLFASAPVKVWFDTNSSPMTNILLLSGTSGSVLLSTTNAANLQPPPNIYEGQIYYLGVQNPNAVTVNYGVEVDFDHGNSTNSTLPQLKFIGIVASASGGGTTLKWTASPSAQFQVQWTDDLTQPWNTDPVVIKSDSGNFTFTDDGSQTARPGTMRFYRLVQISP